MEAKLVLAQVIEVYHLGSIVKPVRDQGGIGKNVNLEPGEVYVYYEKTPDLDYKNEKVRGYFEAASFWGTVYYPGHYPILESHEFFRQHREPYGTIIKHTRSDGSITRYMSIPTGVRLGEYKNTPLDLSKWDADIIERLRQLPMHVRDVYGI